MPEEGLTGDPRSQRSAHCLVHQVPCAVPAELREEVVPSWQATEKKRVSPALTPTTWSCTRPCLDRALTVFSPRIHREFTARTRCSPGAPPRGREATSRVS